MNESAHAQAAVDRATVDRERVTIRLRYSWSPSVALERVRHQLCIARTQHPVPAVVEAELQRAANGDVVWLEEAAFWRWNDKAWEVQG